MPDPRRPLILLVGELLAGKTPRTRLSEAYVAAVERAGGRPLVLPYRPGPGFVGDALDLAEGVVITGADDFTADDLGLGPTHPAANPVPLAKQRLDLDLALALLAAGVPVLGICYGMQLLALAEGAGLHQHLPDDVPGGGDHGGGVVHPVAVVPGTKLHAALGVASLDTVSRHHQAISSVGRGWVVSGRDGAGLIEAVERTSHPFALGVQWHPEASPAEDVNARLFAALVDAARAYGPPRGNLEGARSS